MTDLDIRNAALFAVQRLWRRHGDSVPFQAIEEGFQFESERIPFLSRFEGVYKPARMGRGALSVRSTLASRYEDERLSDDQVWYDYSPHDSRNRWLRQSLEGRLPILYFLQVKPKPGVEYLIFAPVEVVEDDPRRRRFLLDLSPSAIFERPEEKRRPQLVWERLYGVSVVKTRLFQAHFRRRVLEAYGGRCSVCSLGERPVLDGAHLVPDREELGEPKVTNGLALCALHHRAMDRDLLGVTPDLTVHVFRDRLERPEDAASEPLTSFHGERLRLPGDAFSAPDRELVKLRWRQAMEA